MLDPFWLTAALEVDKGKLNPVPCGCAVPRLQTDRSAEEELRGALCCGAMTAPLAFRGSVADAQCLCSPVGFWWHLFTAERCL